MRSRKMNLRISATSLLLALLAGACTSSELPKMADTELLKAIRRDDTEAFGKSIADKALVNTADKLGRTPLMLAAGDGRESFVKQLIAAGAEVNAADVKGNTALHFASASGTPAVIKTLLDAGADPAKKDVYDWMALTEAARLGNVDSVKLLIAAGTPVDSIDREGKTALIHAAASKRNSEQVVRLLIDAGANLRIYDKENLDALMWSIKEDNEASALLLLSKLPAMSEEREFGLIAMQWAIKTDNPKMVEELIVKGVPLNLETSDFTNVTRKMQAKGISKVFANYGLLAENRTPLMWAAIYGKARIAALLIARGSDIKAKDNKGNTAYDYAKDHATAKVIKEAGGR
jgi:uncharacterized protein